MNCMYVTLPPLTLHQIEKGLVLACPSVLERYVNLPKTATLSADPKSDCISKASLAQILLTVANVSMIACGPAVRHESEQSSHIVYACWR